MITCENCEYQLCPKGQCCNDKGELFYVKHNGRYRLRCERLKDEIEYYNNIRIKPPWYDRKGWTSGRMGRDTKEYAGDINGYTETVPTDPHSSIFRNIENSNQDQQEKEAMLDRQEKRVQDAMSMAKTLLTAREYEVISEIFVKGVKAVSLAKSWGCSKANISKLQKKAVDKLKTVAGG